jgi:hypothetical protein
MAIDDKGNLQDLHSAEQALIKAKHALQAAMVGQGPRKRDEFVFNVGVARGRLSRISSRIYGEVVPPHPDDIIDLGDA